MRSVLNFRDFWAYLLKAHAQRSLRLCLLLIVFR